MRKAVIDWNETGITDVSLENDIQNCNTFAAWSIVMSEKKDRWALLNEGKILVAFGHYEDVPTKQVEYITSPSTNVTWDKDEFEKWACTGLKEGIYSHHTEGRLNGNTIPFSFTYRVVEK